MSKWKWLLTVALAAAVLIIGAFLPRITTGILDLNTLDHPGTSPMLPVELTLKDGQSLSMLARLKLYGNMASVPIMAEEASMTAGDAVNAARAWLETVKQAGIYQDFEADFEGTEVYLAIDPRDTSQFSIFWAVTLSQTKPPYRAAFLHLDDATGAVVRVSNNDASALDAEDPYTAMLGIFDTLSKEYFYQLGLPLDKLAPYIQDVTEETGKKAYAVYYHLSVPEIGDFQIRFSIDHAYWEVQVLQP